MFIGGREEPPQLGSGIRLLVGWNLAWSRPATRVGLWFRRHFGVVNYGIGIKDGGIGRPL